MFQFEPARFDAPRPPTNSVNHGQSSTQAAISDPPRADGAVVIISTRGRPAIVNSLVRQLAEQTRPPEHIFVIAATEADIAELDQTQKNLTVRIGRPGSTFQRNDGLALASSRFAYIVFFDDDFVPSRFWLERMAALFEKRPDIAGMTGTMLDDGTHHAGVMLDDAKAMVAAQDADGSDGATVHEHFAYGNNVGCNMAYRYAAMHDVTFDERLPAYAWHEDSDFRGQVERRGLFVRAEDLWGVHLGHKTGRGHGVTLGYSQIANAVYLARKGTVPARFLATIASRNVLANAVRSLRPEPYIDRRGRLRGNLIALTDLIRGRITPERILEL